MFETFGGALIVWICISGVYGLFDLFARKNERMAIIEKMGDKLDSSHLTGNFNMLNFPFRSFSSLKAGCLLVGLGLGLLVGLLIQSMLLSNAYYTGLEQWKTKSLVEVAWGGSVLLFGGIGLLLSFLIENKISRRDG